MLARFAKKSADRRRVTNVGCDGEVQSLWAVPAMATVSSRASSFSLPTPTDNHLRAERECDGSTDTAPRAGDQGNLAKLGIKKLIPNPAPHNQRFLREDREL